MSQRSERMKKEAKVELSPLDKDGEKLLSLLREGGMAAVLSGLEVMYIVLLRGEYHCFIHGFDAEDGRHKSWDCSERNTAMLKNLAPVADHLFAVHFQPEMNLMGVMEAAERGIISYLDATGQLPAEDTDFMEWKEKKEGSEEKE